MTQPTLLAHLYKFILESAGVDVAALQARFPEEFAASKDPGSQGASRALSDALCFLLDEKLVVISTRGQLVHRSVWKAHAQIRLERSLPRSREVGAN